MITQEIIRTCSNAYVAAAALLCIGGDFLDFFMAHSSSHGLPPGVLAARMVKKFSEEACGDDWNALSKAARGSDHPILCGFQHILTQIVAREHCSLESLPKAYDPQESKVFPPLVMPPEISSEIGA